MAEDGGPTRSGRSRSSGATGDVQGLAELRAEIDRLDREIVRLLNERARLGIAAGRAKAAAGRRVPDPERERQVLLRVAMANEGPLPQGELVELYRRLIEAIKGLEERQAGGGEPT